MEWTVCLVVDMTLDLVFRPTAAQNLLRMCACASARDANEFNDLGSNEGIRGKEDNLFAHRNVFIEIDCESRRVSV